MSVYVRTMDCYCYANAGDIGVSGGSQSVSNRKKAQYQMVAMFYVEIRMGDTIGSK